MIGFPLLLIPFAIYHMIAFLMQDVSWSASLYLFPGRAEVRGRLDRNPQRRVPRLFAADADVRVRQVGASRQVVGRAFPVAAARRAPRPNSGCCLNSEPRPSCCSSVICFVDLFAGLAASLRRARRAVVVAEPVPVQPARRTRACPCACRARSRGACPRRAAGPSVHHGATHAAGRAGHHRACRSPRTAPPLRTSWRETGTAFAGPAFGLTSASRRLCPR